MPNKTYNRVLDENLHILVTRGCHEAFLELKKRYHRHASVLCNKLLEQYPNTGISKKELVSISDTNFPIVVRKYVSGVSSLYIFWETCTKQVLMDYLVDYSYDAEGIFFSGTFSLEDLMDNKHGSFDFLNEKDPDRNLKRKVFEVKSILAKYDMFFTTAEKGVMNLVLSGYSLMELEKTGLYKKSQLYLTFKNAIEKIKRYLNSDHKNNK